MKKIKYIITSTHAYLEVGKPYYSSESKEKVKSIEELIDNRSICEVTLEDGQKGIFNNVCEVWYFNE